MKKRTIHADCISCGKNSLSKDEIGICIKLLGESTKCFYCLNCLGDYLDAPTEAILAKIEEFKEDGCELFD